MKSPSLIQRSQGRQRPVVPRSDELADGVAAPSGDTEPAAAELLEGVERTSGGQVRDAASAAILGQRGGRARAAKERRSAETPALARGLGLRDVSAKKLLPYLEDAAEFAQHESTRLAQVVGGGECGTGPSVLVQAAALKTAGSRYAFAAGDIVTGSRLADAARADLLSAHDLCAREAVARASVGHWQSGSFVGEDREGSTHKTAAENPDAVLKELLEIAVGRARAGDLGAVRSTIALIRGLQPNGQNEQGGISMDDIESFAAARAAGLGIGGKSDEGGILGLRRVLGITDKDIDRSQEGATKATEELNRTNREGNELLREIRDNLSNLRVMRADSAPGGVVSQE